LRPQRRSAALTPVSPEDVLDLLSALVNKSLVMADEQPDGHMRYRLLETLREYSAQRLTEAGEQSVMLERHAEYSVVEVERLDELRKTNWQRWRHEAWPVLEAEQDNARAVLGRCRDGLADVGGQLELGLRVCSAVWWHRAMNARFGEIWDWHVALLQATPHRVSAARFFAAWYTLVAAAGVARFHEGEELVDEVRALANALNDDQLLGLTDGGTGQLYLWQGYLSEAEEFNDRGLAIARRSGPEYYLSIFLFNSGWTALRQGRIDKAAQLLDESIAVARQIRDDFELSMALPLRGIVSLVRQNLNEAREYFQQGELASRHIPVSGWARRPQKERRCLCADRRRLMAT
jgi:tetratricopeptide (TPR) repeat protein